MIDLIMLEGAKSMGAGAATIASAGAAIGIGNVFSSLIQSVARNPSLAKQLFGYAIKTLLVTAFLLVSYYLCSRLNLIHLFSEYLYKTGISFFLKVFGRLLGLEGIMLLFVSAIFHSFFFPMINMMDPSPSSSGAGPNEISQDEIFRLAEEDEAIKLMFKERPQDAAKWVTSNETKLGDLISELRKQEKMRALPPYRLQYVIECLTEKYTLYKLEFMVKEVTEKGLESRFYRESKMEGLPTEVQLRNGYAE